MGSEKKMRETGTSRKGLEDRKNERRSRNEHQVYTCYGETNRLTLLYKCYVLCSFERLALVVKALWPERTPRGISEVGRNFLSKVTVSGNPVTRDMVRFSGS